MIKNEVNISPKILGSNAFAFSILMNNNNNKIIMPFLYNYFSNIYINSNLSELYFTKNDWMFINDGVFTYYYMVFPKEVLTEKIQRSLITNMLYQGYYIELINKYNIPGCNEYKTKNIEKKILIYGYESESNNYYYLENNNSKLLKKIISENILYNVNENSQSVVYNFVKLNNQFEQKFDWSICKDSIINYIHSNYDHLMPYSDQLVFGLDAIRLFCNNLKSLRNEKYNLNECHLNFIKQHKQLMLCRLKYLCNKSIIDEDRVTRYKEVIELIQNINSMAHIYNLKHQQDIINRILNELSLTIDLESKILDF